MQKGGNVILTLMTYNVFSGRTLDRGYDLSGKIKTISEVSPDILGLNEVHLNTKHSGYQSQTGIYADALGYKYRYFARAINHDGGEYGIALLSRLPWVSCRTVPVPDILPEDRTSLFEPRVHIDAVLDLDGKRIRVLTSHFGLSRSEQVLAVSETMRLSEEQIPTIFMGDLNAEPDDSVLAPLYTRFCDTAEGYGQSETLTFRSDTPTRRIDYIFTTNDFEVIDMCVPASVQSDHRPVSSRVTLR